MSFPQIEQVRTRVQQMVSDLRARFGSVGPGQGQLQGQLITRARSKVTEIQKRVGAGPLLKSTIGGSGYSYPRYGSGYSQQQEFGHWGDITDLPARTRSGKGFSIAEEPGKPYDHRDIVIEL